MFPLTFKELVKCPRCLHLYSVWGIRLWWITGNGSLAWIPGYRCPDCGIQLESLSREELIETIMTYETD